MKKYGKVGVTGTREGMTLKQLVSLERILEEAGPPIQLHHGDCIGVDAEAHEAAETAGVIDIIIHPPDIPTHRAFCKSEHIRPERHYLQRNREIVEAIGLLIAIPKEDKEVLHSGTWATVRYAKRFGIDIQIIFPNGCVEEIE